MNDLIDRSCLEALGPDGEQLVLDVGCGTGQFTTLISHSLPGASRIVAVEQDRRQLATARQLVEQTEPGCAIEFRQGEASALPLNDDEVGQFDLSHARFLLEHVPDPLAVVANMVRALRPGGRIVLADDDHEIMPLWPEPEGVAATWRAYYQSYHSLGVDPMIGRKLVALISAAGAGPSRNKQLFYGACHGDPHFLGIVENLVGVMQGATELVVGAGLAKAIEYREALDNLRRFAERPGGAVWYAINWAEGVKP